MIVADIGRYQALKGYVVSLIQQELELQISYNKHNLVELFNLYSEKEIKNAISKGIRRAGNSVFIQTSGGIGRILRSLEYGAAGTKALHLITKATRKVIGGRI